MRPRRSWICSSGRTLLLPDYLDPTRLFGGPGALRTTMEELPLYADTADISNCPMWRE
jgi:hypothetical protein